MTKNPFQMAIGLTFLSLLFIVPGLIGCDLRKSSSAFVACAPWSDTVLWNRVLIGTAVLPFAFFFWRRAIRSVSR